jgi:hypothetical protein
MALQSTSILANGVLTFICKDKDDDSNGFTRDIDIARVFGNAGPLALAAIVFAAKTALRNSTGGREVYEAEEAVDARIAAWTASEPQWGAERGASEGTSAPFTAGHILAKAVARIYASMFATAADAAAKLSEQLESALSANGHPAFAELDDENARKARNAFVKQCREKDKRVDAAIAAIQAEQAQARAAKAAGAATEGPGLF